MIPSVTKQGFPAAFVEHDRSVRNYNSGMIEKSGKRYLATRHFSADLHRCEIVINELDGVSVAKVRTLPLPRAHGMESFEDGRMFWHEGKIHLAYTEGRYWFRPWVAVQKLAILRDDWSVERVIVIGYGENSTGLEKNWQFFSWDGELRFVYSITPHVVVTLDKHYKVAQVDRTFHGITVPLRGGTPPVRVGSRYVAFPHFHRDCPLYSRRYGFAGYSFEAEPPFEVVGMTKALVMASEADPILPNLAVPYWTPLVIFPCGALLQDGAWTVSAGVNDSFDVILTIPHSRLCLT